MIPNQIDRPVAAGASAGGPRLLLVEDNDDHALLAELALSEQVPGSVLERVKDGPAALRRLGHAAPQSDGPAPDVVVLDLNLPGLSGHEVLRAIKSDPRLRAMPVVVLSTSSAAGAAWSTESPPSIAIAARMACSVARVCSAVSISSQPSSVQSRLRVGET